MVAIDLDQAPEPEAKSPNPNNQSSSTTACEEGDDSWEARMFEEDTLGCTWPPRSYMCTFCKRVFTSAQALGGHMNVHRRERARRNRATHHVSRNPSSSSSSSALIIPTQEFFASGNVCLLYSFPNPNPNPNSIMVPDHAMDPSAQRSFMSSISPSALAANLSSSVVLSSLLYPPSNSEEVVLGGRNGRNNNEAMTVIDRSPSVADGDGEIDLELRLGRRSSPPWTVMAKRVKGSLD